MMDRLKITVVGSLIIDQFVRVERFPKPGETVITDDLEIRFGGKGANQAVAASRLGVEVEMIGCVGDDEFGRAYLERLEGFGIGTSGILRIEAAPTGSAFVTLDSNSENSIVVAAGANSRFTAEHVNAQAAMITASDFLLLQNEVRPAANSAAIEIARQGGTKILYNPAPWRGGSEIDCSDYDFVVVNELEVVSLLGSEILSAAQLPEGVVVTRGAGSTLAKIGGREFEVEPMALDPVDTVGAGDCFCGALGASMADPGLNFSERLAFANRAAGMSTQKTGAQEAMPERADL